MELDDNEISLLNEVLMEETVYAPPGKWNEEDAEALSELSQKVHDEAKRRKLWWAR